VFFFLRQTAFDALFTAQVGGFEKCVGHTSQRHASQFHTHTFIMNPATPDLIDISRVGLEMVHQDRQTDYVPTIMYTECIKNQCHLTGMKGE